MERWTRAMIRYRWPVLGVWLVAFVLSGWAVSGLSDLLTNRFLLPGTDSAAVEQVLEDNFGQTPTGSFLLVARAEDGESAASLVAPVRQAAERAAVGIESGKVASVEAVSDDVVSALIVSKLEQADAKGFTDTMRERAGDVPGAELYLTGSAAIEHDLDPVFEEDLRVGEFFIAVPIALALLVFVFGTLAFLLPFLFAAFAIPVTLGIVWIFANFMELSTYLQNMVGLIGFGIAIDYSLFVIYRYREERQTGAGKEDALVKTMATAGRAVVFSGTAVAIGLALMLAMPLPFMRGFGLAGLIIPTVSVVCALTLLPGVLYMVADTLDRVRLVPRFVTRRRDDEGNMWVRLSRTIMRRPVLIGSISAGILIALALPLFALEVGPGSNQELPQRLEGVQGLNALTEAVGAGAVAPTDVIVDGGRPGGAEDPDVRAATNRLISSLESDPAVAGVDFGEGPQYVDATSRYLHFQIAGVQDYGEPESLEFVDRLRGDLVPAAGFPEGTQALAGGGPPGGRDFLDLTYGAFPYLLLGVIVLTYFLLLRAFRSLLLPLKAIVMNMLSIGAAYGMLVIFFKLGAGEPFGLIQFDQIEGWIPIFVFAMVFGLSMDYEVFLVSRMREEWDAGRSNEEAVAFGLAKTGRIITVAGLIMFAAFMGFVAGSIVGLQQFGFGLAAAILIDVTIVRALLVPSVMALFGRWNWWLPEGVAKVFRVKPSPLVDRGRPALRPTGR